MQGAVDRTCHLQCFIAAGTAVVIPIVYPLYPNSIISDFTNSWIYLEFFESIPEKYRNASKQSKQCDASCEYLKRHR